MKASDSGEKKTLKNSGFAAVGSVNITSLARWWGKTWWFRRKVLQPCNNFGLNDGTYLFRRSNVNNVRFAVDVPNFVFGGCKNTNTSESCILQSSSYPLEVCVLGTALFLCNNSGVSTYKSRKEHLQQKNRDWNATIVVSSASSFVFYAYAQSYSLFTLSSIIV